jgi:type IV secretory pathway VirB2 component (pilin)
MLSHRKPLIGLAAVTATLAVAIPAASANAATTAGSATVDPTVCQLLNFSMGPFGPTMFPLGGASLGATLAHAGQAVNCPAAPARQLPAVPFF